MPNNDEGRMYDLASRFRRSHGEREEAERKRAFEVVEATFPALTAASPDELVQMAIHALGFDARGLAAALGIARTQGEALIRSPSTLTRQQRALLAQYLEMGSDANAASRNRGIAAKLRESIAPKPEKAD